MECLEQQFVPNFDDDFYPLPEEEIELEDDDDDDDEDEVEEEEEFCLKQRVELKFDALMKMDFYHQALKNIEENKAHLAEWVQAIIIAETRDTRDVPARWFHKFMDPENAKIYDTSNRNPVIAHFPDPRTGAAKILKVDPKQEENLKVEPEPKKSSKWKMGWIRKKIFGWNRTRKNK
uniref:Uncharacterized protein n=1 Tax=Acrobeloides nanus TaxID=290746 RepID=A0A914D422_9BILA